jgi:hypothetical protein
MANVIKQSDILPSLTQKATDAVKTESGNIDIVQVGKYLNDGLKTVKDIVKQIQEMQKMKLGTKSNDVMSEQKQNVETVNHTTEREVIVAKPHDKERIKAFLFNLLRERANRLPSELLDMPLRSFVGGNLDTFEYTHEDDDRGLKWVINAERALDILSDGLVAELDAMQGVQR